ncbi:MAG: hypothetical protein Q4Q07_06185, partial [Tissierellia bacterium]|nr:hypothetical protein [Tissierellia bacterium]
MKLGKKVSVYSLIIALLLMVLIFLYLIVLMPKLYMAHMDRENLQRAKELHLGYLKERSYKNLNPPNIYSNVTFVIPKTGYEMEMEGKAWKMTIDLKDEKYKEILDELRYSLLNKKAINKGEVPPSSLEMLSSTSFLEGVDVSFEPRKYDMDSKVKEVEEFIPFGRNSMMVKAQMESQDIQYTTLLLFTMEDNTIIITLVPLLTQSISSILPVVMESLPMILLCVALIVLIGSQIFSKNIINPITKLANHTNRLKSLPPSQWTKIEINGEDEIGQLARR